MIGPLRASILYDLPIFLAYLSIIPGMAVFLVRIETDFAEWYERVYEAIRGGETLQHIGLLKEQMILAIRQGLLEICKVQGWRWSCCSCWRRNCSAGWEFPAITCRCSTST